MIRLDLAEEPTPQVEVSRRQRRPTGADPQWTVHPGIGTRRPNQRQAPGRISSFEAVHSRRHGASDIGCASVDGEEPPCQGRETDDVEMVVQKDLGESMPSAALPREVLRGTLRPGEIVFAMEAQPAFFDGTQADVSPKIPRMALHRVDEIEMRTPSTHGLEPLETKAVVDPRSVERLPVKTHERPSIFDLATHRVEEIGFEMRPREKMLTHDEVTVDVTPDAHEEHPHTRAPVERRRLGINESPSIERNVVKTRVARRRRRPRGKTVDRIQRGGTVTRVNRDTSRKHPRRSLAFETGDGRSTSFRRGCRDGDGRPRRGSARRRQAPVGCDPQSSESV